MYSSPEKHTRRQKMFRVCVCVCVQEDMKCVLGSSDTIWVRDKRKLSESKIPVTACVSAWTRVFETEIVELIRYFLLPKTRLGPISPLVERRPNVCGLQKVWYRPKPVTNFHKTPSFLSLALPHSWRYLSGTSHSLKAFCCSCKINLSCTSAFIGTDYETLQIWKQSGRNMDTHA